MKEKKITPTNSALAAKIRSVRSKRKKTGFNPRLKPKRFMSEKKAMDSLDALGEMVCPFCGERDFDRVGLKMHLEAGNCESWNEIGRGDLPKTSYES